jgi:hypothetical protein
MDLDKLPSARRVVLGLLLALSILLALELLAIVVFDESAEERLSFGYGENTGFLVDRDSVELHRAAGRTLWAQKFPLKKPDGTKRIVVVGDSVLRGGSEAGSLSGKLRERLAACGVTAEVWNLSSPGYGSRRKEMVVRKALEFKPDLVIYHVNYTTEYEDEREWQRKLAHASMHPSLWPEKLPLIGRIKLSKTEKVLWKWLPAEVRNTRDTQAEPEKADPDAEREAIQSKQDAAYWIPRMLGQLQESVAMIRHADVPVLLLSRADLSLDRASLSDAGLDQKLEPFSNDKKIRVLSTREVFGRFPSFQNLFIDRSHWIPAGHAVMAEAMMPAIADLLDLHLQLGNCGAQGAA